MKRPKEVVPGADAVGQARLDQLGEQKEAGEGAEAAGAGGPPPDLRDPTWKRGVVRGVNLYGGNCQQLWEKINVEQGAPGGGS